MISFLCEMFIIQLGNQLFSERFVYQKCCAPLHQKIEKKKFQSQNPALNRIVKGIYWLKFLSIDYPALTAHKTGHMLIKCGEYTQASAMCVKGATSTGYFHTEYPGPPLQDFPRHPIRINIPMKTVLAYQ